MKALGTSLCILFFAVAMAAPAGAVVVISAKQSSNINCSGGVCTATDQRAVLNVTDLTAMLASGDVKIVSGSMARDISVDAPLTWTSTHRLTFDAYRSLTINKPVVVAGSGSLTIMSNDGGSAGDYLFHAPGRLAFWDLHSSLIINGANFVLVSDLATLAANVTANPSGNFALQNNYSAKHDGKYVASPIDTPFQGAFDGLGNEISHLTISNSHAQSAQLGLFVRANAGAMA